MPRAPLTVLLLLASLLAVPAAALPIPATSSSPDAAPTTTSPIADTQDAGSDARITRRISGIFAELPAFAAIEVRVSEGVVTLAGTVPAESDIARAEAIASRVFGVVTVENRLERDVSIEGARAVGGLADGVARFTRLLPLIGLALAVWLGIALAGYVLAGLGALWRRLTPNSFLAELIASAIRFVFVVAGLVVALNIIGATALLGAVLGGAGLVGIALGFAMRDTIENYVASLVLSLRQPFRANDHVVIDSFEGRVIRLTSRATILMTLDGNHLRIANSTVFKAAILNYTRNPQRRFEFTLPIDIKADPNAARQMGLSALQGLDFVLDQPESHAEVEDVAHPLIHILYRGWIDQSATDFKKARSRALAAVKHAIEAAGLAIPDPIYKLQFDSPASHVAVEGAAPPKPIRAKPPADQGDVSPEEAVAQMVENERAQAPDDKDLLDSNCPVE